ncbi:DegT/DnrJ/EryC1/StrS family aminotransferase [bacterium]|nr:DegT/DnrJ/EryC1/StrS family aminotransferase [bacterium]
MIGVGTFKISERARRYINEVLTSERLSYGPYTREFESRFAAFHDCKFAVMTASGTCALFLALAALKKKYGWHDGDEVLVPACTFIATSNIVLQLQMKPVFIDVDPIYYEMDPDKIEPAITDRTRCVIPVHVFGHPCDMDRIMSIAHTYNLRIIEDSCETMFTRLNGKSVGSFGDIGCFSTYIAHILATGVGGLCTTNEPDLAITIRSLMNHGRDSIYLNIDDDKNKSPEELQIIIKRRFSFVQMGYSLRVTELEGALGLAELEEHEDMMRKRWQNGQYFIKNLEPLTEYIQLPSIRPGAGHAFMMFPIMLRHEPKEELVNYLEANGIETRDMLPLTNQPFYRETLALCEDDFPVAKWINHNGFYIACHQGLSELEKQYMVTVMTDYFRRKHMYNERKALIMLSLSVNEASKIFAETLKDQQFDEYILAVADIDASVAAHFQREGFKVISSRKKKGELLKMAITATSCESIAIVSADGVDDPKDIDNLFIKLDQGADIVIASRFLPGGGRQTQRASFYRSIGNRFFSFLLNIGFNTNISDCNNHFRAIKRNTYFKLPLTERGESAFFEMTLLALRQGLTIDEYPTVEREGFPGHYERNRIISAFHFCWIMFRQLYKSKDVIRK